MPQLDFNTYSSQVFWLIIALGVLYPVFRLLLTKLQAIFDRRNQIIQENIDCASVWLDETQALDQKGKDALSDAEAQMRDIIEEAQKRKNKIIEEYTNDLNKKVDAKKKLHEEEIRSLRNRLYKEENIHDIAEELSSTISSAVGIKHSLRKEQIKQSLSNDDIGE